MGGAVTKEQDISHAQYLDLFYSQSVTLYDLIPHAPHPTSDPSRHAIKPPVDVILGSVQTQPTTKYTKKKNQPTAPISKPKPSPKTVPPHVASYGVNVVQSAKYSGATKKGKKN